MSYNQQSDNSTGKCALFGLPIAAMLCCGMPILIGTFGFTAAGTFLTANRYWVFGGLVIAMGIIMFAVARKGKKSGTDACCVMPSSNNTPPQGNQ